MLWNFHFTFYFTFFHELGDESGSHKFETQTKIQFLIPIWALQTFCLKESNFYQMINFNIHNAEAYSDSSKTSKMERFAEIVNRY